MTDFQKQFVNLINRSKPRGAQVSAYIINLNTGDTLQYNSDDFIYPASTYKIFIGAEVLRQIEKGQISLSDKILIKHPNDIDAESRFYPTADFPVLKAGDEVSVDTLLTLMLQRSDNTASNALIDLVGRESISKNIVHANGWKGSDVTRKFLNRIYEDKPYRYSEITVSSGRHLAQFMERVYRKKLVSAFVSEKLSEYMSERLYREKDELTPDTIHRSPEKWLSDTLYEKGGWIQATSKKSFHLLKHRYQSQAAVVRTKKADYAIGILSKYKTIFPNRYFEFSKISHWLNTL